MSKNILRFIIPKSLSVYITDDSTVRQALEKMNYHKYKAVPIIDDDGKYVGTLKSEDTLRYFMSLGKFNMEAAEDTLAIDIIDKNNVKPLLHSATMSDLIENVKEHNFVPVVDDRGCFIGIILRRDILNFLLNYYNDTRKGDNVG